MKLPPPLVMAELVPPPAQITYAVPDTGRTAIVLFVALVNAGDHADLWVVVVDEGEVRSYRTPWRLPLTARRLYPMPAWTATFDPFTDPPAVEVTQRFGWHVSVAPMVGASAGWAAFFVVGGGPDQSSAYVVVDSAGTLVGIQTEDATSLGVGVIP